jgi:hypothetical protein
VNKDIRIATNCLDHPKIRKLQKRLGPEAVLGLIRLWCYAGTVAFDGVLKDLDAEDIGHIAHWGGEAESLINTLLELKLLERNSGVLIIHDWTHWNNFAATFPIRSEIAKRAVAVRERKKAERLKKQDDKSDRSSWRSSVRSSPSPTPTPSPNGVGADTPPLEAGGDVPSTLVAKMMELATEMYRGHGSYVDATKEHQFIKLYQKASKKEQEEVQRLTQLAGIQMPSSELYLER